MDHVDFHPREQPSSGYVRRRLAEATLSQYVHEGSTCCPSDPGPPANASLCEAAQSLHTILLGNALEHVDQYIDRETHALALGEALEAQLDPEYPSNRHVATSRNREPQPQALTTHDMPIEDIGKRSERMEMFLPMRQKCRTTITYCDGGTVKSLRNVDGEGLASRCPLLAMALEDGRSGPQLHLETLSCRTAEPFRRFVECGTYAEPSREWNSGGRYEDVPTSVLLHCEMFFLGEIYDIAELKSQAYVNVLRQCEFGCSSPDKPIDLCAAIRFVYAHLEKQGQLVDAIIHYCVACFQRHRLAEDPDFRQLAYDLRPFHQALCKNCMERDFPETAAAIIQMPFAPHKPETYASTLQCRFAEDVVYHFHATDDDESRKKRKRSNVSSIQALHSLPDPQTEAASGKAEVDVVKAGLAVSPSVAASSATTVMKDERDSEFDLCHDGEASSSDSDSFEWVDAPQKHQKVSNEDLDRLPIRSRQPSTTTQSESHESDSDWSLV